MKKITKYIFSLAVVLFALTSCDNTVTPHEPGEPDESGCYGVYFPSQESSYTLDPAEPTEITVKVARTNSNGAIEVPYTFSSKAEGVFQTSALSFADGATETTIKVSFPTSEVGTKYTGSFVISDNKYASKYNDGAIAFDFDVTREKWNDLGWGTYYEGENGWFVFDAPIPVRFEQNDKDKNQYRIEMVDATGENFFTDDQDQYLKFRVLKAGDKVGTVTVPESGLVYFEEYFTGAINSSYGVAIAYVHPYHFSSTQDPSNWSHNKVLQYQEDGVTPAGVQLAPFYYMEGVGGYNYSQDDDAITIIFPGAVLTDFSLEVAADYTNDDAQTPLTFTVGKDVTSVKYACFEGELNVAQVNRNANSIIDGSVESKTISEFEEGADKTFVAAENVSFDASGAYTVIAVSYAGEENKTVASASFNYFCAADVEENEAKVACDVEDTPARYGEKYTDLNSFAYYVIGEELTDVHMTVVPYDKYQKDPQSYLDDLKADADGDYAVDAATLEAINAPGGYYSVVSGLDAETVYALLVWATNGSRDAFAAAAYETAPNPEVWKSLGKATYTDDIVMSLYGESEDDCPTYEVEIQESQDNPGKYRLVNPYGEIYPYNEPGDYDDSKDYYFVIDATDPDQVKIPQQSLGIDWGEGEISVMMFADYYIATGQATEEEMIEEGYYGALKDGVITFAPKTLGAILGSTLYYANYFGAFKVVLPKAGDDTITIQDNVNIETGSVAKTVNHTAKAFAESVNKINVNNGSFERESGDAVSFSSEKGQPVKVSKAPKAKKAFIAE